MDTYRTEEEQIEAIKKFANEKGTQVVGIIVLAIAVFFGSQGYMRHQSSERDTASLYYSEITQALASADSLSEANSAKFDSAYEKLTGQYPSSTYASYAALHKAKLDFQANDKAAAVSSLQWVIDANVSSHLKALAGLRLAQVKLDLGEIEQAQNLVASAQPPFESAYEELKGDIFLAKNDKSQALAAYTKAMQLKSEAGSPDRFLALKIQGLEQGQQDKIFSINAADNAADKP